MDECAESQEGIKSLRQDENQFRDALKRTDPSARTASLQGALLLVHLCSPPFCIHISHKFTREQGKMLGIVGLS
jgi:hypothetical protein